MCGHMEIRAKAHQWRTRAAAFQRVLHQPHLQCLQSRILRHSSPGGLKYHGQRTLPCNSLGTFSNPTYSDREVYPNSVLVLSCKCRSVGLDSARAHGFRLRSQMLLGCYAVLDPTNPLVWSI